MSIALNPTKLSAADAPPISRVDEAPAPNLMATIAAMVFLVSVSCTLAMYFAYGELLPSIGLGAFLGAWLGIGFGVIVYGARTSLHADRLGTH